MIVITFANQKGGSGKTTMSANVAAAIQRAGHRVLLVDMDPQQSALKWARRAASNGHNAPTCIACGVVATLRRDLSALESSYDVCVIDTPPRIDVEMRAAIAVANVVIVPVHPGGTDLGAAQETVALIEEMKISHPALRASAFINGEDRTMMSKGARRVIAKLGINVLDSVRDRTAFDVTMLEGRSVVDDPDSDSAIEIRRLTKAIFATLEAA